MNRLCYVAMRHKVVVRVLLMAAVMAVMAIALGPSEIALADGCDGFTV